MTLFYGGRRAPTCSTSSSSSASASTLVLATEDGSRGERGRVTVPLDAALAARPPTPGARLYACGPEPMLARSRSSPRAHGRACDVSVERVMGCGLGGCYSCVVLA